MLFPPVVLQMLQRQIRVHAVAGNRHQLQVPTCAQPIRTTFMLYSGRTSQVCVVSVGGITPDSNCRLRTLEQPKFIFQTARISQICVHVVARNRHQLQIPTCTHRSNITYYRHLPALLSMCQGSRNSDIGPHSRGEIDDSLEFSPAHSETLEQP